MFQQQIHTCIFSIYTYTYTCIDGPESSPVCCRRQSVVVLEDWTLARVSFLMYGNRKVRTRIQLARMSSAALGGRILED